MLSIGELSRHSGVKIPTIRYYEEVGLLSTPERTAGNQRRYSTDQLDRLSFIRHARGLGLSIEDIHALVELGTSPEMACTTAHQIAHAQLDIVREKLKQLRRLEKELKRIVSAHDQGNVGTCFVFQALAEHRLCGKSS